ncbi:MAG: hypothetical protein NTY48_01765 [Candidatus Diapherotrites archaeon]|nr:hypothetical protein [Candidatus Diapherotrites archaeon]
MTSPNRPKLLPPRLDALTGRRAIQRRGEPIIYPESGIDTATMNKVIGRLRLAKERTIELKYRAKPVERERKRLKNKILAELETTIHSMTPAQKEKFLPLIKKTIEHEITDETLSPKGVDESRLGRLLHEFRESKHNQVLSHSTELLRPKSRVTGKDIAKRFLGREVLEEARKHELNPLASKILARMVVTRSDLNYKGTKISVIPPRSILLMSLINAAGEKKAIEVLSAVSLKAQQILKTAKETNKIVAGTKQYSDAFINAAIDLTSPSTELEMALMNKTSFAKDTYKEINVRQTAIKAARIKVGVTLTKQEYERLNKENYALRQEILIFVQKNHLFAHEVFN